MAMDRERPGGREGLWAVLLLIVCCLGVTLFLVAGGAGVAAVGAARASIWLVLAGLAAIALALAWRWARKARKVGS